ncbi:DUF262 domain-containing protein [Achromobacter sp. F4_2707]|uniref:DUF262 domain-containing protein n=1 Tax=Achromobacter sp. F4_2707 TaxID=3114286 RepID=UPI0039C6CCBD
MSVSTVATPSPNAGVEPDPPHPEKGLKKGVATVAEFLSRPNLNIPNYQRPYKWTAHHVHQLFADINRHKGTGAYRLGTIVLHRDGDTRNIVDGQQRTVSLVLAIHALVDARVHGPEETRIQNPELAARLSSLAARIVNPGIEHPLSQANVRNNYLTIRRIVSRPEFTEDTITFLLDQCEIVWFELRDISEAFQFFDSQNARGRDLEPHDLLKAFHLREFAPQDEPQKARTVSHWERVETEKLATLFGDYLFRIRNWSRNASARHFGKAHIHLFKGVNMAQPAPYPYMKPLLFAEQYLKHHNQQVDTDTASSATTAFPFHFDQPVINGRHFFEMIAHYDQAVDFVVGNQLSQVPLDGFAPRILETLNRYAGHRRTGDTYVRLMFDCLLIAYIDKFGLKEIARAVEKTFIWAYSLRLQMQTMQLASVDNYVLENNRFLTIKEAVQPDDFLSVDYPSLSGDMVRATRVEEITQLFKDMLYHE